MENHRVRLDLVELPFLFTFESQIETLMQSWPLPGKFPLISPAIELRTVLSVPVVPVLLYSEKKKQKTKHWGHRVQPSINLSPVLVSEPGSVGDFCTTERVPKKLHLSPPPPSFPPMSVLGLGLLSSGVVRKGTGLSWNQLLYFRKWMLNVSFLQDEVSTTIYVCGFAFTHYKHFR